MKLATIAFPALWKRTTLLDYARSAHPRETVRIVEWHSSVAEDGWEPFLWLANPDGFDDYRLGHSRLTAASGGSERTSLPGGVGTP